MWKTVWPASALQFDAGFGSQRRRQARHGPDERVVVSGEVVQCGDVPSWHDEHVQGGLGADIPKRDERVVLMQNSRGNLTADDLAEEAIAHAQRFYRSVPPGSGGDL